MAYLSPHRDSSEESELASAVPSGPRKNKAQPSSAKTAALNGRCFTTIKPTNISCAVTSKKASSIMQTQYNINIPLCHGFIEPFNAWWKKNLARFPEGYEPCNMIHAQRIPAVPEATRCFLTEHYCPPSLIANILDSDTNRDCIIRPYLGRRRVRAASKPSRFQAFSLRNYPLHLDQMEEIGIPGADIAGYARTMAKALAQLHWLAHVDGNDIEFVLASPNDKPDPSQKPESWSNALGVHEMWMLDFDLARPMTMVEQGAQQAAIAFKGNDPYYPRPDKDSYLWIAFREQYLATSQVCLQDSQASKDLPAYFIHLVEELNGANNHNQ